MTFTRVKMQWVKMDAVRLVTEGLPTGKEHRMPEQYFDDVLEGSRIVAEQCAKDIVGHMPCIMKQTRLCNIMLVI